MADKETRDRDRVWLGEIEPDSGHSKDRDWLEKENENSWDGKLKNQRKDRE
jgi:hypothetical protein